jgi:hypothetical protein
MPTRRFPPPWSVEEYNDPPKAAATRPSLRDFKTWNGFHDLLISISSDVIAALESEPPEDKAADRAALSRNAGRR